MSKSLHGERKQNPFNEEQRRRFASGAFFLISRNWLKNNKRIKQVNGCTCIYRNSSNAQGVAVCSIFPETDQEIDRF